MKRSLLLFIILIGALAVLAIAVSSSGKDAELSAQILGNPSAAEGFVRVDGSDVLSFPADFGPHPDYQTEWWYYTGHLETEEGRHFGYQLTFFRRALLPSADLEERTSDWGTNQIYMGHFALSDVEGDTFYASERFSRGAAGLAGAEKSRYKVWLEDWQVEQISESEFHLVAANDGIKIDLILADEAGPILQGAEGYSVKGPEDGNASYYYSQTRLASQGEVRIGASNFSVQGLSWKDHEYSTSALSTGQVGWDWFSIQLDNGYDLMLYQVRRSDGSIDSFSSGKLIAPDGETTTLSSEDFQIESVGTWRSPHSGATYPMGWKLILPAFDIDLELSPYLEDQELNLSFTYWEGAVSVSGIHNGQSVAGDAYVEMTGYADSLEGQF